MSQSAATERAILGAAIVGGSVDPLIELGVHVRHFVHGGHSAAWGAMLDLANGGSPPDVQLIAAQLGDRLEAAGGFAFLASLSASAATSAALPRHVLNLQRVDAQRRLRAVLEAALHAAASAAPSASSSANGSP